MPNLAMPSRYWGLVPKRLTWWRDASSQRTSGRASGAGLPSYVQVVAPVRRVETTRFHIIQWVVVYQRRRSPGPRMWPPPLRSRTGAKARVTSSGP
jgi:hypothetical protein